MTELLNRYRHGDREALEELAARRPNTLTAQELPLVLGRALQSSNEPGEKRVVAMLVYPIQGLWKVSCARESTHFSIASKRCCAVSRP